MTHMLIAASAGTDAEDRAELVLGIPGFEYADLHDPHRLADLDAAFLDFLWRRDHSLHAELVAYRSCPAGTPRSAESALLVGCSRVFSEFLAVLFGVSPEREIARSRAEDEAVLFRFRMNVLMRRTWKKYPTAAAIEGIAAEPAVGAGHLVELALFPELLCPGDQEKTCGRVGHAVSDLQAGLLAGRREAPAAATRLRARLQLDAAAALRPHLPGAGASDLDFAAALVELYDRFLGVLRHHPSFRTRTGTWSLFSVPHPLSHDRLVESVRPVEDLPEERGGPPEHYRLRDGFTLTDPRMTQRQALGEAHYCVLCAARAKDSCSTGLKTKTDEIKRNPLGIPLRGCPLEEKISEIHELIREGDSIGAIALATLDNPMLPGTGHRICNDCMKACIFQTQDPVNIPQAETSALTSLLAMPWGFEIWSLLTRWNPLRAERPVALPYCGRNILVVGMGPAGYTLAHHLLNEGFGVVGVDGLKIEPLAADLVGSDSRPPKPIRNVSILYQSLDRRVLLGFGGVSEYGITVRWDKNFLALLYLNLLRRSHFRVYGGVRFGGTLTAEQAFEMGFDHVAVAAGAGRPTIVDMKNNLVRGIRQASDFLMALQLTGAFKREALASFHLELPALVIGGGLTAIDTATEALAYYPLHAERMVDRADALVAESGEEAFWGRFTVEERATLGRMLEHGRAVREERRRAAGEGRPPNLLQLCQQWGGSAIVYRRSLEESPAYRLNHEEVIKAFEEGVSFVENVQPLEAVTDEYGALTAVILQRRDKTTVTLPCRSLLIAAGTTPNITYAREREGTIPLDARGRFFQPHRAVRQSDGTFALVPDDQSEEAFFTGASTRGRFITYFGDNHPVYAGSVVKAMASAKRGAPRIRELFEPLEAVPTNAAWTELTSRLDDLLRPRVTKVERLTPTVVEVTLHAPAAARNFRPGQFFRFQNYETEAATVEGTRLLMEPCALTGATIQPEEGLISLIALELGATSRLCSLLRPGEPVVLMGPTGTPTEIPENSTMLLCGGGLGNAVLFSIAKAARSRNTRVLYFAGYKRSSDLFKREQIEDSSDAVVFSVDQGDPIAVRRPQDRTCVGNIVEAMVAYAEGRLGAVPFPLAEVDRVLAIGSDRMMAAVAAARHGVLRPYLNPNHKGVGSINSPMQCMMKEVCAQCLQRHVDPTTGEEFFIFSCYNQDQDLDFVDWRHLRARLAQNTIEEKISDLWLARLLSRG